MRLAADRPALVDVELVRVVLMPRPRGSRRAGGPARPAGRRCPRSRTPRRATRRARAGALHHPQPAGGAQRSRTVSSTVGTQPVMPRSKVTGGRASARVSSSSGSTGAAVAGPDPAAHLGAAAGLTAPSRRWPGRAGRRAARRCRCAAAPRARAARHSSRRRQDRGSGVEAATAGCPRAAAAGGDQRVDLRPALLRQPGAQGATDRPSRSGSTSTVAGPTRGAAR